MIKLQPKKDKNAAQPLKTSREEFAFGHRRFTGVGPHRNRLERRTGRRVLAERAIRDSA